MVERGQDSRRVREAAGSERLGNYRCSDQGRAEASRLTARPAQRAGSLALVGALAVWSAL